MAVRTVPRDTGFQDQVKVFASAFRTDPLFKYFFGPDVEDILPGNEKLFAGWMRTLSKKPEGRIVAHAAEDGSSAAVWMPGGAEDATFFENMLLFVMSWLLFGWSGMRRFTAVMSAMEKYHPKERHAYLVVIGTAEGCRGKGTGSAVMREMLRTLDAEKLPAYLESSNPANYAFYERHGFKHMGLVHLPKGAPPLARMWRTPQ